MAKLIIAAIDEVARIPAPKVTQAVVIELTKKYRNSSDKIRAMQEMNKHPFLKQCNLKLTWRFVYED